jgi:glutathione synthase
MKYLFRVHLHNNLLKNTATENCMNISIGIIMDPIENIKITKDSSFAMMLAAQRRGWTIHYMQQYNLYSDGVTCRARSAIIEVVEDTELWYEVISQQEIQLSSLDVILMRKDPPYNIEYITTTWLLDQVEREGSLVINKPSSLRDANEKLFITHFPQCCAPALVSRESNRMREFIEMQSDVVLKPLDSMGGHSIFRVRPDDPNLSVILELMTDRGRKTIMAQKFIPEISAGDKRILLIDGEAVPYALARIPAKGEFRGNLVAGATGVGVELSDRDRWICEQVSPILQDMGIMFAGIDVIGDYLSEINITSPTCIRELDRIYGLDIASKFLDAIEAHL